MIQINKRRIAKCILLSIVTFGGYLIYWKYLLIKNIRSLQKDESSCAGELLCLLFIPFYDYYWWFTRGKTVKEKFAEYGHTALGSEIAFLVLAFCGRSIISMAIMQNDFNSLPADSVFLILQENPLHPHIVKRVNIPIWKKILIYAAAIVGGLLLSSLICSAFADGTPLDFFACLFKGAFGSERKIWLLLLDAALLLGASMALIPAFKMKFWNLGGNGQMLVSCLCAYSISFFLGDKIPEWILILLMFAASILSGIIWAVIPALFKAFFNTNETLFTLMMNYIAAGIVLFCRASWITSGSAQFPTLTRGLLPVIYNNMLPTVVVFVLLTLCMFIYLKYSKHGYEISVVGESVNTAKYVGIDVKKVIVRTMVLSGAIAGLVGFFLIARTGPGLSSDTPNNMGFTAIMTSWLAAFNPLMLFLSCFFIAFITRGMSQVQQGFSLTDNSIVSIVVGLIYFCVIACSFFINYKIVFRKKEGKKC